MRTFKDQLGRTVLVPDKINKIISTVPSQTELLFYLGLGARIIGRTKFCIHPKEYVQKVPIVGGTKNLRLDRIKQLRPDIIIGNKEENEQDQILEFASQFPIWMSDVKTWGDGLQMINELSDLFGVEAVGHSLVYELNEALAAYNPPDNLSTAKVAYLIWNDPIMAVGRDTFINHMLSTFGVQNALSGYLRYPELNEDELKHLNPTHIFLSSEPFPFKEKHIAKYQRICPDAVIKIVDGELFSWYGSRMLKTIPYFKKLVQFM